MILNAVICLSKQKWVILNWNSNYPFCVVKIFALLLRFCGVLSINTVFYHSMWNANKQRAKNCDILESGSGLQNLTSMWLRVANQLDVIKLSNQTAALKQ